jgi:hypothetical protein
MSPGPADSIVALDKMGSALPSSSPRVIVRLELTPDAKRKNEAMADQFGMTQIATLSRLVNWFALQPPEVQAGVLLGQHGPCGAEPGVVRAILERIAAGGGGTAP